MPQKGLNRTYIRHAHQSRGKSVPQRMRPALPTQRHHRPLAHDPLKLPHAQSFTSAATRKQRSRQVHRTVATVNLRRKLQTTTKPGPKWHLTLTTPLRNRSAHPNDFDHRRSVNHIAPNDPHSLASPQPHIAKQQNSHIITKPPLHFTLELARRKNKIRPPSLMGHKPTRGKQLNQPTPLVIK